MDIDIDAHGFLKSLTLPRHEQYGDAKEKRLQDVYRGLSYRGLIANRDILAACETPATTTLPSELIFNLPKPRIIIIIFGRYPCQQSKDISSVTG